MDISMAVGAVHQGDCVKLLHELPEGSVDLVFADPPFNIGYEYDVYSDKKCRDEYLGWSRSWIEGVHQVLKPSGTFWLAIGDEYAAELKLLSQDIGFHSRSWVVWYYTFGVNCTNKFTRSHAHLFYFVKDKGAFTFRADDLENRIPSARQLVYADARANPNGRLPDDTWLLRPQDLAECFTTAEDTWYFPRVAGTFKERAGFHGCQMPEQLLGRIIRACSGINDIVLDPFSGSATTAVVAKKLGRRFIAFDLSQDYVTRGNTRLATVRVGDPPDGASEPTLSAPATPTGQKSGRPKKRTKFIPNDPDRIAVIRQRELLEKGLVEAFQRVYDGFSLDRVVADPALNRRLGDVCVELGLPGELRTWNRFLFGMRKRGQLAQFPTTRRTDFQWEECEDYLFASEIAWRQLIDEGHRSLDDILCDPFLAARFDALASRWAPDRKPLEYRWAALKLRKAAKHVRARASLLGDVRFSEPSPLDHSSIKRLPDFAAVYIVRTSEVLYAGEAGNLRNRLLHQFGQATKEVWKQWPGRLITTYFPTECAYTDRLAYQRRLVMKHKPRLNLLERCIA